MEPHIKFLKPVFSKSVPFSTFLCSSPSTLDTVSSGLTALFSQSQLLTAKYETLRGLWNHVLALRPSRSMDSLAIITDDGHLAVFDFYNSRVNVQQLPITEGVLLCCVAITGNRAIIGCIMTLTLTLTRNRC